MRRLVGILILFFVTQIFAQAEDAEFTLPAPGPLRQATNTEFDRWPEAVFVDPDLKYVSITKDPGQTWQDCKQDQSKCLGWPDGQTQMTRDLSEKIREREELNPRTGELETIQYMKVKFKYERDYVREDKSIGHLSKDDIGWIDTRVLRKEKLKPVYSISPTETAEPPVAVKPKCKDQTGATKNQSDIADLRDLINKTPKEQLNETIDLLKPLVGRCPLKPPNVKKPAQWKKKNIYDTEALPLLTAQKTNLPVLPKLSSDGKSLGEGSFNDVVAIDTLARTLYSEMNECFRVGIQFPMAAAKVAVNRAEMVEDGRAPKHFYAPPQATGKPSLSKVLTSPYQFSVWNQIGVNNPKDKTVLMSLCPSRDNSKNNWRSSPASRDEVATWDLALKIATEAVLFKPRFLAKTAEVSQLYYTSKMKSYDERERPSPAPMIEGRAVESFKCMYVWNGR